MKNVTWEQLGFTFIDYLRLPVLLFLGTSLLINKPPRTMLIYHDIKSNTYVSEEADRSIVFSSYEDIKIETCAATLTDPKWSISHESRLLKNPYQVSISNVENTIIQVIWTEESEDFTTVISDKDDLENLGLCIRTLSLEDVDNLGTRGDRALVRTDGETQIIDMSSGDEHKTNEQNELKPQEYYGWQVFYIWLKSIRF